MQPEFYQYQNYLVYRGYDEQTYVKVLGAIEDALRVRFHAIAVPRTLRNSQLLRWLNLPVAPVMDKYDWPHGPLIDRPTEAQKLMANFLVLHARSFNLSDMGTMKTLAALWAADYIMQQYANGQCRCLINAPLTTLQRVWGDALFTNFMSRRSCVIVHHNNAEKRRELLAKPADFYLINPDGLKIGAKTRRRFDLGGLSADLYARHDIKIAIVDEASAYRDRRTGRHRVASVLYHPQRMPYLWLLTGTPCPNAPTDAYGLARLVNNAGGESYTDFHRRTMVQVSKFKWMPAHGSYAAAAKLLQPAIRFAIEDIWDGPPMTVQARDVMLSDRQRDLLAELKRELSVQVNAQQITPANEAAMRGKALQIVQGAIYDESHLAHTIDSSPRLKALEEVIEQATKKVLVFVPLTSVVNLLVAHLTEAGYGVIKINGEVPIKDRDRALTAFKADDALKVAVCDPAATAHGINEFACATSVCWYGPTDKAELWLQGNKRAHRPGQSFPVTVVCLSATALEREIFRRVQKSETLQGVMLSWIKQREL
jgi:SNF2 family DNA or RNA helicase